MNKPFDSIDDLEDSIGDLEDSNGDLIFPKASEDIELVDFQKDIIEFITSVILKHEQEFYQLAGKHFANISEILLTTDNQSINEMIKLTTNKFYDDLCRNVNEEHITSTSQIIIDMQIKYKFVPRVLLDELRKLTLDTHLGISREKLILNDNSIDLYQKSILMQLNLYLSSFNMIELFSKLKLN